MAVRKRGNKWQADVTVKGHRLPRYSFGTEDAARAWEMEARAAALVGKPIPVPSGATPTTVNGGRRAKEAWTLEKCLNEAMQKYWRKSSGARQIGYNIEALLEFFGKDKRVSELTDGDVVDFIDHCAEEGNSGSTINRKLSCLSKALKLAKSKGVIDRLPHIERQKENQGRIRWLTDGEEQAFHHYFKAWRMDDHLDAFICLIDTGFRPSELWTLEARDINFTTGLITLWETKTSWPRSIPMTTRVREIMLHRTEGGRVDPFDWGLPVSKMNDWFRNGWEKVRLELNLDRDPQFVPYTLRHTCCSRLVQRGMDLYKVSVWMGHKSLQTTRRYAHLAPKHLMELATALEQPAQAA